MTENNNAKVHNIWSTTDIILAAALKVHGYRIDRIEKNSTKGTFFFTDVSQSFIDDYDLGVISVEPIEFNNAVKSLTTATRRQN